MPSPNNSPLVPPANSHAFEDSAYQRISKFMVWTTIATTPALWIGLGMHFAIGFIVGCVIAIANFQWLKQIVNHLADKVIKSGRSASSPLVARFLLRYSLIALAAYIIFKISVTAVYGLFAGLTVPIAAVLLELLYEARTAFQRGTD